MSDDLILVQLLSSIASATEASHAGAIVSVRADVAAAWIALGLATPVTRAPGDLDERPDSARAGAAPEAAMRPRSRARG